MHGWGFSMRSLITAVLATGLVHAQGVMADGMVDPTRPPVSVMAYLPHGEAQLEKAWELSAIQDNGKNGFAVVNGQMVPVGGYYEDFKLISVTHQKALFVSKLGEKKVLTMGLSNVMTPVTAERGPKKASAPKRVKHQSKKTEKITIDK
jgi:hypothetical protein